MFLAAVIPSEVRDASEMSVEEAIATTQMAFHSLTLRLFKAGAISVIDAADFACLGAARQRIQVTRESANGRR